MNIHRWRGRVLGCLLVAVSAASQAQLNIQAGASTAIPGGGVLGLGCNAATVQGSLDVGGGQVTGSGDFTIGATGVVNGGSGSISVSGNWSNSGNFAAGTGSVIFTDGCATGPITISGTTVFNNLTMTSSTGRNFIVQAGSNIKVDGILTLQGTPQNPISVTSSNGQTVVITLGPQAQVVKVNVNVNPSVQIGAIVENPQSIPTLSEYALILLMLLMALAAGKNLPHLSPASKARSGTRKSTD